MYVYSSIGDLALTYVGIKKETKEEKKEGLEDSESCALRLFDIVGRCSEGVRCNYDLDGMGLAAS